MGYLVLASISLIAGVAAVYYLPKGKRIRNWVALEIVTTLAAALFLVLLSKWKDGSGKQHWDNLRRKLQELRNVLFRKTA